MTMSHLRSRYRTRVLANFLVNILLAGIIMLFAYGLISMSIVSSDNYSELLVFRQPIMAMHLFAFTLFVLYSLGKSVLAIAFSYKQWDSFNLRVLNKVTLADGTFQIALDSPIFVTYSTYNREEIKKLEEQDHVTVVAYGTRFIALY